MAITTPIHFYKDCLRTPEQKKLYDEFEAALFAKKNKLTVPLQPWMLQADGRSVLVRTVFEYVFYDQPGLFYVNHYSFRAKRFLSFITFEWEFTYTLREIADKETRLQQVIDHFKRTYIRPQMNSAAIQKAIFDYLIQTVKYIDRLPDGVPVQLSHNKVFEQQTAVGALLNRSAVCEGVAEGFKMLADACRLISIIATGPVKNSDEYHAWNIVKVQGCFYHMDATWGLKHSLEDGFRMFRYCFYNLPDNLINVSRSSSCRFLPPCTQLRDNPFQILGLTSGNMQELHTIANREISKGETRFCILCTKDYLPSDSNLAYRYILSGIRVPAGKQYRATIHMGRYVGFEQIS